MLEVALLLHPNAHHNRSMQLYAERLSGFAPPDQRWRVVALPGRDGRVARRLSELLVPPVALPQLRADVVHVVDHAHAGYLRYVRGPSVVTVHDLIPLKALAGEYPVSGGVSALAGRYFRWNMRALPRATALVTPSAATAADLRRLLALDATVVPNGVEPSFFEAPDADAMQRVRARLPPPPAEVLLQVSSGFIYKNDAAVEAVFERLASARPNLHVVRVGSPLPPPSRRRLRRAGLSARYHDFGPADPTELIALYHCAQVLLFPSWDEGFGWPPVEAMAVGCPVVASQAGALRETVGPHGLTAAPDDVEGLAAHVQDVLSRPHAQASRVEAAQRFARRLSWQRTAEQLSAVYRRIAR